MAISAWSLWMTPKLLSEEFALFLISFSGLIALAFLVNAFDRKPQVIINETGIYDRSSYNQFINWDVIDHAYWKITYGQRFVCIIIKDEFKPLINIENKLKQISLATGFQEINIRLNNLAGVNIEKLNALIVMMKDAKPFDRSKLLVNGVSLKFK